MSIIRKVADIATVGFLAYTYYLYSLPHLNIETMNAIMNVQGNPQRRQELINRLGEYALHLGVGGVVVLASMSLHTIACVWENI